MKVIAVLLVVVLVAGVLAFPAAWALMVSLGIIHSHVPAWPALSFGESFMISLTLTIVFGNYSASSN